MITESIGANGHTYRLSTNVKAIGPDTIRIEYVVHTVMPDGSLEWGHYFNDLDSATRYWIRKLREA